MKKLLIGIAVVLCISLALWGRYVIKRRNMIIYRDDYVSYPDSTIATHPPVTSEPDSTSINLKIAQDSIRTLNEIINDRDSQIKTLTIAKDNNPTPKTKQNEKFNNVSVWSSIQYNEFLANRYRDSIKR